VLTITHFTDPGCPWAFSAEPPRRAMLWRYGERLRWRTRMVVLSESAADYEARGFGPAQLEGALADLRDRFGMPIRPGGRIAMLATVIPCRAVVAARETLGEDAGARLLRALRIAYMVHAQPIDAAAVVARAAADAGLDAGALAAAAEDPAVESALRADMRAARTPSPEARALDHKLGGPAEERRYTCPSWEVVRDDDGRRLSLPGFQPQESYEVALANLAPEAPRRPAPGDPREVLQWAGEDLALREVAAVMGTTPATVEEALRAAGARERDGLWGPPDGA